jgi:decaprenylphospho-beta-D-erythro-pentofuranosid-2-ulose 2-reductase
MNDAFDHPQSIVVLGGTSDIARRLVAGLTVERCRSVVLAGRDLSGLERAAGELRAKVGRVEVVQFDATDPATAEGAVARCFESAGEQVDLAIVAVGQLGRQEEDEDVPGRVAQMVTVNFTWPAAALTALATRFKEQGHGAMVVLSSVAGYRVRRSNYLYGSSKAGLDGFALGLGESLRGTGVSVHIVRPGFVHTKMTEGMSAAPFAVDVDVVSADILRGLQRRQAIIWSPGKLRAVFSVLRLLPQPVWRRLPG